MTKLDKYDEVIVTNGIKVPFVPRIITPNIERPMRNSRYEGGELKSLRDMLRPGDRLLELGAGVGLLSAAAALVEGVTSVTAVEANPEMIPLIEETYRLNEVDNVNLLNGVVTHGDDEKVEFFLRKDFWASSMDAGPHKYTKKLKLPCYNIHKLITDVNPTIIACDIEGGELGLFDNANLSNVRAMILEFHPKVYGEQAVLDIYAMLESKGLKLEPLDKKSTVRCFVRDTAEAASTKPGPPKRTELTGLTDKPWKPKTARFLVSTCMKDEGPFILEWLAFHKSIGIQDFIVFTNDCTDGTVELLDRLQDMGELTHLPNPALAADRPEFQPYALAYTPHLRQFKEADFFISLDVDEFINIRVGKGKMSDLLTKTGEFDALSISELNHGSNRNIEYERGLLTAQFPQHQREAPGKWRSRRGVKSIVRIGEKLEHIRNHRPDLRRDRGPVKWLDGSGNDLRKLHDEPTENGLDVRGTYDLVSLEHYALRSLHSYLVKMFRGDVVVKNKMVSQRYWRTRDRNSDLTSTLKPQQKDFKAELTRMLKDKELKALHEACCAAHEARIAELLETPTFRKRKDWILDNWAAEDAAEKETDDSKKKQEA